MSIQAVSRVLDTVGPEGSKRLVLIALANHAGDHEQHGPDVCWPSVDTLAREANLTRRGTQLALRWLEANSYVEQLGESKAGTRLYQLVTGRPVGANSVRGAKSEGAKSATSGGEQISPEPSVRQSSVKESLSEDPSREASTASSQSEQAGTAPIPPVAPDPLPSNRYVNPTTAGERSAPIQAVRLATLMRRNDEGAKLPACFTPTLAIDVKHPSAKGWLDPFRLLIDTDGRDPDLVTRVLIWSQNDQFWRRNILSPANFRQHFPKLMLAADANTSRVAPAAPTREQQQAATAELAEHYRRQRTPASDREADARAVIAADEARRKRLGL